MKDRIELTSYLPAGTRRSLGAKVRPIRYRVHVFQAAITSIALYAARAAPHQSTRRSGYTVSFGLR